MVEIVGYYRAGFGTGKANLVKQKTFIEKDFPEISAYHHGTLNVRFQPRLIVAGWDHRTQPIKWDDNEPEVFDFVRVFVSLQGQAAEHTGLIYVAHRSDHRKDPHKHELLIAEQLHDLRENMLVCVRCERPHRELPYLAVVSVHDGRPKYARTVVIL
jgi:hypothetical protein